jgi:uncharacterized protein (DUF169 family)
MPDWKALEQTIQQHLALPHRPVAVAFCATRPSGIAPFAGTEPSSCSFWRLAAGGRVVLTEPRDHHNCAIGGYTHNVPLPPERAQELPDTLAFMTGLGYVKMEEVPGIPRLPATPAAIVYAPLGDTPLDPDVVLFAGRPRPLMLLQEAAHRAGAAASLPLLGRPTCMALPAALAGGAVMSTGCVGNRIYTDLGDDELYVAAPGRSLPAIVDALATIVRANAELADYHRGRRTTLASA